MKTTYTFEPFDIVLIYQNPFTFQSFEGEARIIFDAKKTNGFDDKGQRLWTAYVQFDGEEDTVFRRFSRPAPSMSIPLI